MRLAAGLALVLALGIPPAAAAETSAKDAARAELAKGYQDHFPNDPMRDRWDRGYRLPAGVARILLVLTWTLVAVAAAGFLFAVVQRRRSRADAAAASAASPPPAPSPPRPERRPSFTLDDADRLAAEGSFRDAVHALLLAAIGGAARSTVWAFPPSATSRELSRSFPLTEDLRLEFTALVGAVERSLFAGGTVEEDEYRACRERCLLLLRRAA